MPKTWILDLDGTILVHDGPYIMGKDQFLPGGEGVFRKDTGKGYDHLSYGKKWL